MEKNNQISDLKTERDNALANYIVAKSNASTLEGGLAQCKKGVEDTKAMAENVAKAGEEAVRAASANRSAVNRAVKKVDEAVAASNGSCEDALAILKGGTNGGTE